MGQQVSELSEALTQAGFRLTAARQAIAEALVESGGHISADELADLVRDRAPGIGRMTVYRTLDILSNLGAVRPVYQGTGAAHYVLMKRGHHHHLVCNSCGQVLEVEECTLGALEERIGRRFDFEVQGHLVEFYGRCGQCRERDGAATNQKA